MEYGMVGISCIEVIGRRKEGEARAESTLENNLLVERVG